MKTKAQIQRALKKAEQELQDYNDQYWGEEMPVLQYRRLTNKVTVLKWVLK